MRSKLPTRELEIARRFREFRERRMIPRAVLAARLYIGGERLASYEGGRAPLRADVALKMAREFDLSLCWLATGEGDETYPGAVTAALGKDIDGRLPFSHAYDEKLGAALTSDAAEGMIAYETISAFLAFVRKGAESGTFSPRIRARLLEVCEAMMSDIRENEPKGEAEHSTLPNMQKPVLSAPVIAQPGALIDALRKRLARATESRGAKRALAKLMGVSAATVSEWLSGASAPTADNTLRLLQWVSAVEAQRRKTAPVLEAPTRRKAQASKTRESKTNSGPPRSSRRASQ